MKRICPLIFVLSLISPTLSAQSGVISVGAKHFNEGYILSEMVAILLEDAGYTVNRKFNLGGTAVTFQALRTHNIDIYPEYSGTIATELLKKSSRLTLSEISALVKAKFDLEVSKPYGFNNTYALVMRQEEAEQRLIAKISDLRDHPDLNVGLSYEFLKRQDGWDELADFYNLNHSVVGLEHGLAYQAILENRIDITDAYSTDGEIVRNNFLLLKDDQQFFPDYKAVSFYRASLPSKAKKAVQKLTSVITEKEMQLLNAKALTQEKSHQELAYNFLLMKKLVEPRKKSANPFWLDILDKTLVHLKLTVIALLAAVIVALPLGVFIYKYPAFSKTVLYMAGILQTIPSIALLALMIPLFGIGTFPAVVALFFYSLLPILRNTAVGLFTVDPELKKVAAAIGLDEKKKLKFIELPLAMPTIITGIRTAAVINVGTATLAAFIGAGGLGEFIVTGLALNNTTLILKGAVPAALLAILIELLFEGLELLWIPKHLRSGLRV